jgi:hypothetical protein
MSRRRPDAAELRQLATATLAFLAWLDGGAASPAADHHTQEARRRLRALGQSSPPPAATYTFDALGRLTRVTHAPAPSPAYYLRLGASGELLVVTRADVFVFVVDEREGLHFVARRERPPDESEGDGPL